MTERPRRGRRPARTAEELRRHMIAVGLQMLAERGLAIRMDTVRFDEVIDESDAPRASAYRAWNDPDDDRGPQQHFHEELAAALLREQPGFSDQGDGDDEGALAATLETIEDLLTELPDLGTATLEERAHWFRQTLRAGSDANQNVMDSTVLWRCYIAIAAGLTSRPEVPDELLAAWRLGEQRLVDRYMDLYQAMATLFGIRLRYCYTWDQFDTAAAALAEGIALRAPVSDHVSGITRNTGPDGTAQEWTLFAVCFEGLVRQFFEPDPDEPYTAFDHEAG